MSKLSGVYVVMTTPFKKDGSFDFEGIEQNIEYFIDSGVHGILVAGATGEFGVMSVEERKTLVEFAMKHINGRVPAVVGAISARAEDTIDISNHAAEHGAEGVMILPPPGAGLDEEEIFQFYKQVNDNINTSIMVYNNPHSAGVDIEVDLLCRIAELDKVDCVKESSGDIKRITEIRGRLGDKIGVFCGWEDMSWESFMAGASGWVCVCANFAPRMAVELFNKTAGEKEYESGLEVYRRLLPSLRVLESGKLIQATKAFQNARDIKGGYSRLPRLPLSPEEVKEVVQVVETTGIN